MIVERPAIVLTADKSVTVRPHVATEIWWRGRSPFWARHWPAREMAHTPEPFATGVA